MLQYIANCCGYIIDEKEFVDIISLQFGEDKVLTLMQQQAYTGINIKCPKCKTILWVPPELFPKGVLVNCTFLH